MTTQKRIIILFTCFIFAVDCLLYLQLLDFSIFKNQVIRYKNNEIEITRNTKKQTFSRHRQKQTSKKTCIYLHGSGVYAEHTVVTENFADYWGNIKQFTSHQCDDHYFVITDTYERGWDDIDLQQTYCNATTFGHNPQKIIITHSMGGLILGASFHNKTCDRNRDDLIWIASQTPLKGSIASNNLVDICRLEQPESYSHWFYRAMGEQFGYCNSTTNKPATSYQTMHTNYKNIQQVGKYSFSSINKMLCGTSAFGLYSKYSMALEFLEWVSGFKYINDGMVSIESCMNDSEKLCQNDETKNYYCPALNHADGTCRNGNSNWYSLYPCTFFNTKE